MAMGDNYILDEHGEPVRCDDLVAWAKWFQTAERHVAQDITPGGARVSTVFLGVDHGYGLGGPGIPVLWETMVFDGPMNMACDRYTYREAAERGHARMLARVIAAENGEEHDDDG